MILFAGLSLAVSTSFLYRKAAYDAVDVAMLSSLMTVEKRSKPTRYIEDRKDEGDTHYHFTWPTDYKNYIYIDESKARGLFQENLYLNFNNNTKDSRIISWNYTVKYDNERYLDMYKNLPNLHTQNYSVTHWECDEDSCWSWTEYFIFDGMYNPESWWITELSKHLPGPAAWTDAVFEEKKWRTSGTHGPDGPVPFPRWVEIKAEVTAEVPSPLGNIFGKGNRQIVTITAKAVREIDSLE
jgi:hypothetical protein